MKNVCIEKKEVVDFLKRKKFENLKDVKSGIDKFELFILSSSIQF